MQWRDADDFQLDKVNHVTVMAGNLAGTSGSDIRALSDAERECARGIADGTGRSRFVAGRAFLRRAIGHVLGDGPYRGGFVVGKFGKPYLPPPHASLSFNVSHTGDLIVAAFMRGSAIGVDVEKCDRAIPPSLPAYVFNRDELDCISTCDDWKSALLLGWTCKEAVLKCIGCGLLRDPKRIKVFVDNDGVRDSTAHEFSDEGALIETYRIIPLAGLQGAVGVIAVRNDGIRMASAMPGCSAGFPLP